MATAKPLIVPVFVPHHGCPHRCVFCNQVLITGTDSAAPRPENIRRSITAFLAHCRPAAGDVQIAFYGGNFLGLSAQRMMAFLSEAARFVEAGNVNGIRFSTRPDTIDFERLALLTGFPVRTIELGAQSMDERVLALSRRGHTAGDTRRAAGLVKARGYRLGLQMMVGLPGDDETLSMESARRIADLAPDFVRIYPTVVVSGSRLADWHIAGTYVPWPLERAVSQVARLALFFRERKIRVIRMGLQASADLRQGDTVLAGPYHPAFGHLVFSKIWLDRAAAQLARRFGDSGGAGGDRVTLRVHPRFESRLRGMKNDNLERLRERFHLKAITVCPDPGLTEDAVEIG